MFSLEDLFCFIINMECDMTKDIDTPRSSTPQTLGPTDFQELSNISRTTLEDWSIFDANKTGHSL